MLKSNIEKIASETLKDAVSPPNWSGTVKAMKSHKEITNPYALSWFLSKSKPGQKWGPGGKLTKKPEPHYKPEKKSEVDIVKKLTEQQPIMQEKMSFNEESIIKDVVKTIVN